MRELFNKRIARSARSAQFLFERGFHEVETPMLQPMAGGAAANPFMTHYKALGQDMFLRIAPELYLKRLLVGGFDKVFELNRNFRNEGLDRSHNPEFTMLEIYEAYSDVRGMMKLVQDLITHVAKKVFGGLKVGEGEQRRSISRRRGADRVPGADPRESGQRTGTTLPFEQARRRREAWALSIAPMWNHVEITHEIYEKLIEKSLIHPTFVTRFPAALIPLAKQCEDDPSCVDVFELVIRGWEIAPAYSELNDPHRTAEAFGRAGQAAMRRRWMRISSCAGARHAAGRRHGHRDRPAGHGSDRGGFDPRRGFVPAIEVKGMTND